MKKIFILNLLIIILLLSGCGTKNKTTTNGPTNGEKEQGVNQENKQSWKVYRNEDCGFEIKYPQEWLISEEDMNEGVVLSNLTIDSKAAILPGQVLIQIEKKEFAEDRYIPDVTDFYSYAAYEFGHFTDKIEKIKLASLDAYKARFHHENANLTAYIIDTGFKNAEGKYFEIIHNEGVETELVNEILSTFKLIE